MENLACSPNWLDGDLARQETVPNTERRIQANSAFTTTNSGGNSASISYNGTYVGSYYYPYYFPYTYTQYIERPPIDLKLSEVEYLRKQAKGDKKLRDILQKFTLHIRITVDFE